MAVFPTSEDGKRERERAEDGISIYNRIF